jgi:O-acetyl-ADP-ribose deacetylase (regulator of RNase III)
MSMVSIDYARGDATSPPAPGPKIICHVCNDVGGWGSGFVVAVSKRWSEPEAEYRGWFARNDGTFRLGAIQLVHVAPELWVANMIGQHGLKVSAEGPPIRYDALARCLAQLGAEATAKGASVHMPRIGCGLAGGEWAVVEGLIREHLTARGIAVTVYDLEPSKGLPWELWRQDDGGNRYLIESFGTRREAEEMQKKYEDRGHKQVYWVTERARA